MVIVMQIIVAIMIIAVMLIIIMLNNQHGWAYLQKCKLDAHQARIQLLQVSHTFKLGSRWIKFGRIVYLNLAEA